MIRYAITAALAVGTVAGAFFYGQHTGVTTEKARQADVEQAITKTREAAQQAAAEAIAKIKPQNITIRQELEREIQTNTVYRDCRVPADGVRIINEAITGQPQPTGGGQLSTAGGNGSGK